MEELSIFVDESGRFQHPDPSSRFYIIGMVFHDQSSDISHLVADLARAEAEIGIENHCFHATIARNSNDSIGNAVLWWPAPLQAQHP